MVGIENYLSEAISCKQKLFKDKELLDTIDKVKNLMLLTFQQKNKILLCGNGGSTCDANHIAEELTGKYSLERPPLAAISINDAAHITCTANDYGFEKIFERAVEALGKEKGILFAFSTSGNSKNVINAVSKAKELNIKTVGFLGKDGGKLKELCDIALVCPSQKTSHIQEMHITIGHLLIELVENEMFRENGI